MVIAYQDEVKEDICRLLAELQQRIVALETMVSGLGPVGGSPRFYQMVSENHQDDYLPRSDLSWPAVSAPCLTGREIQILHLIRLGYLNKQIAAALGIRGNTVKNHVSEILKKLNANCRTQAVIIGLERGFISLSQ